MSYLYTVTLSTSQEHMLIDNIRVNATTDKEAHDDTSSNKVAIIDWKETMKEGLHFRLENWDTFHKKISRHIDFFMNINYTSHTSVVDGICAMYIHTKVYYSCDELLNGSRLLILPCQSIYFHTWKPSYNRWVIRVHKSCSINITIIKAYVPVSHRYCIRDYLRVLEYTNMPRELSAKMIDHYTNSYCGRIQMESIYTRHNAAHVTLALSATYSSFETEMLLVYTSLLTSLAYKFTLPPVPRYVVTNVPPSFSMFLGQLLHHYWYLTHGLVYTKSQYVKPYTSPKPGYAYQHTAIRNIRYKSALIVQYIDITHFTCRGHEAQIHVYAGLLTVMSAQHKRQPFKTFHCYKNGKEFHRASINFHMHTTFVLSLKPLAIVHANFTFGSYSHHLKSLQIVNNMPYLSTNVYFAKHGSAYLSINTFYAKQLSVDNIHYNGEHSIIHSILVNRNGKMIRPSFISTPKVKVKGSLWTREEWTITTTEHGR